MQKWLWCVLLGIAGCVGDAPDIAPSGDAVDAGDAGSIGDKDGAAIVDAATPVDAAGIFDAGSDAAPTCDPAVVSIWHGDGTTVDSLARNPLTWSAATQATYASGQRGQAFDFSSAITNPIASTTNAAATGFPVGLTSLTLSVWANPYASGTSSKGNLITVAPSPASADTRIALGLGPVTGSSSDTVAQVYANGQFRELANSSKPNVQDEWTHYVVTLKTVGTNLQISVYVNGVLSDNATVPGALPPMGTPLIQVGGALSLNNYRAKIDEVAIYQRALDAGEVAALYAAVFPANCP